MDGLLADHADDIAIVAQQADALPDEHLWVPAADPGEIEEAVIVDIGDDDANLINVAGEQQAGFTTLQDGGAAAADIGVNLIGEGRRFFAPDACRADSRQMRAGRTSLLEGPGALSKRLRKSSDMV